MTHGCAGAVMTDQPVTVLETARTRPELGRSHVSLEHSSQPEVGSSGHAVAELDSNTCSITLMLSAPVDGPIASREGWLGMDSSSQVSTDQVAVRRLPRVTSRMSENARWEVIAGGRVIGWIEEQHLRGASKVFYFAIGVHPTTGQHFRLEGNTDFDDRVNVIADFYRDPMTSRQHLPIHPGSQGS